MPSKKKSAKKYEMTRAAIAEELSNIIDDLSDISTDEMSPNDVSDKLSEISEALDQLANHVGDEAL